MPWTIGSTSLPNVTEETNRWNGLELVARVTRTFYENNLQTMNENAGKAEGFVRSTGTFVGRGKANGDNSFKLLPPANRSSVYTVSRWYCTRFSKRQLDGSGDRYEVRMSFIPERSPRLSSSGYLNEDAANDEWGFSLNNGSVATRRVSAKIDSKTKKQITSASLRCILSDEQAFALKHHFSRLESVVEREYPDGKNRSEDASPDKRNTVHIEPAETGGFNAGLYRVSEWELSWTDHNFYEMSLDVSEANSAGETVAEVTTGAASIS